MVILEEIVELLDENLEYIKHEVEDNGIVIWVRSSKKEAVCPYCGTPSTRVHSRYKRVFQDLPIQGKKVTIVLIGRKMFCDNEDCEKETFAETFDFIDSRARMTKRLKEEIVRISMNMSSVQAAKLIRENIANIGKSSICNLLKKNCDDVRQEGCQEDMHR